MICKLLIHLFLLHIALIAESNDSLKKGLEGHWTFDEMSGDIVKDHSTHHSHGKLKGDPRWIKGIVGDGALEFDGNGDYVEILENNHAPSQLRDLEKGSIAVWFKTGNIPVGRSILPVLYYGNKNGCPGMFDASNEGLIIEIGHGDVYSNAKGVFYTVFSNRCSLPSFCFDSHSDPHLHHKQGIIKENQWYHFVVVVGEDYNTGYLNGEKMDFRHYNFNTKSASQFFADALKHERMWIGKGYWDHAKDAWFEGSIDDLRIYNRALNKQEVQKLYQMKK